MSNNDTVISALKQQTLEQLTPRLSLVIEETADYLFSLSTSTRLDPANQNPSTLGSTSLSGNPMYYSQLQSF